MASEFIGPDDPRWASFLEGVPHDVYHRPEYVRIDAGPSGGRAIAFLGEVDGARCLVPLVESKIPKALGAPEGATDLASPYGYANPLVDGDPAKLGACLRAFAAACRERGAICAFLRSNPLLSPPLDERVVWEDRDTSSRIRSRGETLAVLLGRPLEEIRTELRSEYKRRLNRLRRMGFHTVVDDWRHYDRFIEVYRMTMERLGAQASYFFDRGYYDAIATRMKGRTHLISVLDPGGTDVVAGGLFYREGDIVQFHLSGWDPACAHLSPSKLVLWAAIEWANDVGASWLHLGGGLGTREDELFRFKRGFTDRRLPFHTLGIVAERRAYDELVRASGAAPDEGYFPAYRSPRLARPSSAATDAIAAG
ncbi:MAG TPA: GNAT family N-acetyltransferase [Vulgatibacter sp.]|nr:GNAT family N-acetyltransferase [Vulgatibacter sp.]